MRFFVIDGTCNKLERVKTLDDCEPRNEEEPVWEILKLAPFPIRIWLLPVYSCPKDRLLRSLVMWFVAPESGNQPSSPIESGEATMVDMLLWFPPPFRLFCWLVPELLEKPFGVKLGSNMCHKVGIAICFPQTRSVPHCRGLHDLCHGIGCCCITVLHQNCSLGCCCTAVLHQDCIAGFQNFSFESFEKRHLQ